MRTVWVLSDCYSNSQKESRKPEEDRWQKNLKKRTTPRLRQTTRKKTWCISECYIETTLNILATQKKGSLCSAQIKIRLTHFRIPQTCRDSNAVVPSGARGTVPLQAQGRFRTLAQAWPHVWARDGRCTSAAGPWGPPGTSNPQPPIPCEKSRLWKLIYGEFSAAALPCMSSGAADGLKATTRLLVCFFFPQYLFFSWLADSQITPLQGCAHPQGVAVERKVGLMAQIWISVEKK